MIISRVCVLVWPISAIEQLNVAAGKHKHTVVEVRGTELDDEILIIA